MAPNSHNFELEGRRIWVAGHRGMVGSALMRRLASENCELLTVDHASLDLRRQADVEQWMRSARPQVGGDRRGAGRWNPGQQPTPGRVPLRQHRDAGQHHRLRLRHRRGEAAVPRLVLRLSAARAAADPRRFASDVGARADQPVVLDRQDRRHHAVPSLSRAVRLRLHLGHADQPLRTRRQLRSRRLARSPRPAAPLPHRQARRPPGDHGLGHRHAAPRVSPRRRLRRCARVPAEELLRSGHHQRRNRHRSDHRRAGPDHRRRRRIYGSHRVRSVQARRHATQAARCRQAVRAGMEREHRTARGHRLHVRVVPRAARNERFPARVCRRRRRGGRADERAREAPIILSSRW